MTFPPLFERFQWSLVGNADALPEGLLFMRDCMIVNPDGTGFGDGMLDVEVMNPRDGDFLRLRAANNVSIRGGRVFFRDQIVTANLPVGPSDPQTPSLSIRFAPGVYWEALAALLGSVELCNPTPVPGDREITVRITDADNEATTAYVALRLQPPHSERDLLSGLEKLCEQKRLNEAAFLAKQSSNRYPDNADIHYTHALILANMGEIDAAIFSLQKALECGKDAHSVNLKRAEFEWLRGNAGAAINYLLTASTLDVAAAGPRDFLLSSVVPSLSPQMKWAGMSGQFVSIRYSFPRYDANSEGVIRAFKQLLVAKDDIVTKLLDTENYPDRQTLVDDETHATLGGYFEDAPHIGNSLSVGSIQNARLRDGYVWNENGDLVIDSVPIYQVDANVEELREKNSIYKSMKLPYLANLNSGIDEIVSLTDKCVFLDNAWSKNYFHWHLQVLATYSMLRAPINELQLKIGVVERAGFQRESLRLADIPEESIVFMRPGVTYRVAQLFVPSSTWVYHLDDVYSAPRSAFEIFDTIRDSVRSGSFDHGKRIYIARFGATDRTMQNELELAERLRGLGFEIVQAENLSFVEQVKLFSDAEVVVGAHGAGLTNCVYCRPGTTVIELAHRDFFVRDLDHKKVVMLGYTQIFAARGLRGALYLEYGSSNIDVTSFFSPSVPIFTWRVDIDRVIHFIAKISRIRLNPMLLRPTDTKGKCGREAPNRDHQITFPPSFQNLNLMQFSDLDGLRQGVQIFKGGIVVNPDGTGFGNGRLEIEIINPQEGDGLRVRYTSGISMSADEIYFREQRIAVCAPITHSATMTHVLRLDFVQNVYFDAVAALLASVELRNPLPSDGRRKIQARIIDADNDSASADVYVDVSGETEPKRQ